MELEAASDQDLHLRPFSVALSSQSTQHFSHLGRVKRIWYLSPMWAAVVQASLRIPAVSPEPPLLAHTSSESRGTFRQKARSLAPLNGWACAVKICHAGILDDTNSLDAAYLLFAMILPLETSCSWRTQWSTRPNLLRSPHWVSRAFLSAVSSYVALLIWTHRWPTRQKKSNTLPINNFTYTYLIPNKYINAARNFKIIAA